MSTPRAFVITGPSGVGKGTLIAELRSARDDIDLSVSVTTRPRRDGERDGIDYVFLTDDAFDATVRAGGLLEHATYAGYRYGTPRTEVERRLRDGRSVILEIEVQGARQVKRSMPDALHIFIRPPSLGELERRLAGRGTDDDARIEARLSVARAELRAADEFDKVILNDDRERAARELIEFVGDAVR